MGSPRFFPKHPSALHNPNADRLLKKRLGTFMEVRTRSDKCGVDPFSDVLPFGRL
jgi:hypothetical protein